MWPESQEQPKPLRTGLTTGCCATACCVAAARALLGGWCEPGRELTLPLVPVTLPRGESVSLPLSELKVKNDCARAATIKDAGDDPDVTHGATVFVELRLTEAKGVHFRASKGVGIVTRTGLPIDVGEAAINPVPRKMMREHLEGVAREFAYEGGFDIAVGVERGDTLALKTMNPRLGILGGLSILGTTGIVRPFSCSAYIASIHQGLDVAGANGITHVAAVTGNRSEEFIRSHFALPDLAIIEMGDFVGAVLKYLKKAAIPRVSLCGGIGKLSKLANGHLDLHSRASSIDFDHLAMLAARQGANAELITLIRGSNTSIEALRHSRKAGIDLATAICQGAMSEARKRVPTNIALDVWAVDREGRLLGSAGVLS